MDPNDQITWNMVGVEKLFGKYHRRKIFFLQAQFIVHRFIVLQIFFSKEIVENIADFKTAKKIFHGLKIGKMSEPCFKRLKDGKMIFLS